MSSGCDALGDGAGSRQSRGENQQSGQPISRVNACFGNPSGAGTHLVHVQRVVHPVAQEPVALHQRVWVRILLVVVQDVVADGGVRAQMGHERHLRELLGLALLEESLLGVLVASLL